MGGDGTWQSSPQKPLRGLRSSKLRYAGPPLPSGAIRGPLGAYRESLQRERERADQAEREARQLRGMLEEARKPERPWWQRVFGG
jgi:hypothetical protein